ncbi:MAG: hypothetical protein K2Y32_06090 [Candidatus Obscuribacterales bacterium]|nr:hypothetical protein [Candidatus Obscuribacterales bacterium]
MPEEGIGEKSLLFEDGDLWTPLQTIEFLKSARWFSHITLQHLDSLNWDACLTIEYRSPNYLAEEKLPILHSVSHPDQARRKALRNLAVLHFVVAVNSSPQVRCAFSDELPTFKRLNLAYDIDQSSVIHTESSTDMGEPLIRSKDQLRNQFSEPRQSAFFSFLLRKSNSNYVRDVQNSVVKASTFLTNACHQWSESERLLTAITSIEMLMSANTSSSDYKLLQSRIRALIGIEEADRLELQKTFELRHHLVHHGKACLSSRNALYLAVACLVNFSNLAAKLQCFQRPEGLSLRDAALQYLDMLSHSEKLAWIDPASFPGFESVNLSDLKMD